MTFRKLARKALKNRYTGWAVAALVILWFSFGVRVRTVEKKEWKDTTEKTVKVTAGMEIEGGAGTEAKIDKDGNITLTGPVKIKTTRTETGTERTTSEGKHTRISEPINWTARVGASVLVPPPFKIGELRKQLEADVRIGKVLIFDVGAGVRVIFPPASYVPEFYGVGLSLTF